MASPNCCKLIWCQLLENGFVHALDNRFRCGPVVVHVGIGVKSTVGAKEGYRAAVFRVIADSFA
jgi:hypothetical protein